MKSSTSLNMMTLTTDDLDACLDVVDSYWSQIKEYTSRPELRSDDLETLFHYFEQLVEIVSLDLANDQGRARILPRLENEHIFDEYFSWLLKSSADSTGRLKEHLLAALLPLCRPSSLLAVVLPDVNLCQFLVSSIDYAINSSKHSQQQSRTLAQLDHANTLLGQIVLSISKAIAANQDLFLAAYSNRCAFLPSYSVYVAKNAKLSEAGERFPIISAMLSIALISGEAGDLAREAIVLLVDAVRQHDRVDIAVFLAENTDLCPVLATGLSGLFSTLPRVLMPDSNSVLFNYGKFDSFFQRAEPVLFVECFRFVNRVVTLAHPAIRDRLVDFLYHGFLVPVLAPALNQPVGDELIATIAYLDYLCLQNLSDGHVAGAFVKFLLSANYDGIATIDTLIKYLDIPSSGKGSSGSTSSHWRLLFCVLAMFHSFLSLQSFPGSDDVFFELIHRHLANLTYLMRSQRLQLVSATKQRLKSMCIMCSLAPLPSTDHLYHQHDTLPNAFYKRSADHYLSLVTLDAPSTDSDSLPDSPTETPPTPTQKHLYSVAKMLSLEDCPIGRQLLSEYTAMLEEAPRRLAQVDGQTQRWRKCGTVNTLLPGLCAAHRHLVMEQRDDERFFDADIWGVFETSNPDGETSIDDAEQEIDDFVQALGESDADSGLIEDALEQLDMADLSGAIAMSASELPFEMNVAGIGQQRTHSESFSQSSSAKISVGPFLTHIFELTDHFTELPAPVIVALATLLSYLASIPHPLLAPLLLDPQLNVHPNVKSLPLVLSAVRERFVEKVQSLGCSTSQLQASLDVQCQEMSKGDLNFDDQMRHWSPSTSPLPTDENHFSSPPPRASRFSAIKKTPQEAPNSPRSFFSRLLTSSNRRSAPATSNNPTNTNQRLSGVASRLLSPQRTNSIVDTTPMRRENSATKSISTSSSSEFELTQRSSVVRTMSSNSDRLSLLSRSLVMFDVMLLELAATASSASRRFL